MGEHTVLQSNLFWSDTIKMGCIRVVCVCVPDDIDEVRTKLSESDKIVMLLFVMNICQHRWIPNYLARCRVRTD